MHSKENLEAIPKMEDYIQGLKNGERELRSLTVGGAAEGARIRALLPCTSRINAAPALLPGTSRMYAPPTVSKKSTARSTRLCWRLH
jgi:hypothetical protein